MSGPDVRSRGLPLDRDDGIVLVAGERRHREVGSEQGLTCLPPRQQQLNLTRREGPAVPGPHHRDAIVRAVHPVDAANSLFRYTQGGRQVEVRQSRRALKFEAFIQGVGAQGDRVGWGVPRKELLYLAT